MFKKLIPLSIAIILVFSSNNQASAQSLSVSKTPFKFYQKNYIAANYMHLSQQGKAIFFSFHDHDPRFGNTNFHTHLYENPFEFEKVKEQFQSIEISGQYYLNKRFALNFKMPYKINTRYFKNETPYRLTGLGDLSVAGLYHFYDSDLFKKQATFHHVASLQVEGKIKTGKYNKSDIQNDIDPYLQTGTGSFDLSGTLNYNFIYKHLILKAAFNYYYTGISYYQLKFGNYYTTHVGVEYLFYEKDDFQSTFLAGLNYQHKTIDKIENKDIVRPNSFKGLGIEGSLLLQSGRYALQLNSTLPLYIKNNSEIITFKRKILVKIFCLI